MPIPLSPKAKSRAFWYGLILMGLVGAVFLMGNVPSFPQADADPRPRAPARVFSEPEVKLPKTAIEARAVALIEAGKSDEAKRLIESALAQAQEPSLGRLRYL